jgi:MoaA/NifB/PqqE/SkfB family radical SAM enzyme
MGVANISVSTVCNQHCAYCFTVDHLADCNSVCAQGSPAARGFIPIDAFDDRLDFLKRSNIHDVRFLGGEPTLHPQFVELVDRARAVDMGVVVFTNGLIPEGALTYLESLPAEQCTVLVNVNQPASTGQDGAFQRKLKTMRRLGKRALPGFNIYRLDCEMDFLTALIDDTGCKPMIRLGMAQPCLTGANQYIHPGHYRVIAIKIVRLASRAAEAGVKLDFDCGFVRCMFSDDELNALQAVGANVGWWCNPILDVDIWGDVIHCYPLSQLARLPLRSESDASKLRSAFEARTRPYRLAGVFKECSVCPFKATGECKGGCLATTIRRFRHTPFHLKVPGEAVP